MKKSTSLSNILQTVIPKEQILPILEKLGYIDVARKFTVYDLFLFLAEAAFQQWGGYRDGEQRMGLCGLQTVDHSTLSKKAKDVPFQLFKELLDLMISLCNRQTRRKLSIPKELLVVDSTKITVGHGRLPWAPLEGTKAGIKLHVALTADESRLHTVTESLGNTPDLKMCPSLLDSRYILLGDRAYSKHEVFDGYQDQEQRQYFIIRIQDKTQFHELLPNERKQPLTGTLEADFTCQLGTKASRTKNRFRVVKLKDPKGNPVILATNLHWHSPETIAAMYQKRWQIEVFFRWIKQHLNIKALYGTTPNAVYGQLYTALLVYVLLRFLFNQGNNLVHSSAKLTFADFDRLFALQTLPVEWTIYLSQYIYQ